MKWFLLALGGSAAVVVIVSAIFALIGAALSRSHVATRSAAYLVDSAQIYAIIRNFGKAAEWRTGLKSVELLPPVEVRWTPKVGQAGSLSPNQGRTIHVQETTSAQCPVQSPGWS